MSADVGHIFGLKVENLENKKLTKLELTWLDAKAIIEQNTYNGCKKGEHW